MVSLGTGLDDVYCCRVFLFVSSRLSSWCLLGPPVTRSLVCATIIRLTWLCRKCLGVSVLCYSMRTELP